MLILRRRDSTDDAGHLLVRAFDIVVVNVSHLLSDTLSQNQQKQQNRQRNLNSPQGAAEQFVHASVKQGRQRKSQNLVGQLVFTDDKYGLADPYAFGRRPLLWASEQDLIFTASLTGWWHVWTLNVRAPHDSLRSLNPGANCDSQDYLLSRDGKSLFVSHNCDQVDSLGLAVMDVASGSRFTVVEGTLGFTAGL